MKNPWLQGMMCMVVFAVLAGCATNGGGMSDEEAIQGIIADIGTALAAGDIDAMLANYAEDYQSDQGGLEDQRAFLEGAKEQGFLEDVNTSMENAQIAIDGTSATMGPVDIEGVFGALAVTYELEKRDGKWLVVSTSQG